LNESAAIARRAAWDSGGWDNRVSEKPFATRDGLTVVRQRSDSLARGRPEHGSSSIGEQRPSGEDGDADVGAAHVLIWPGRAIYVGSLLENEMHAHHAIQISIALKNALSLQAPPDLRWRAFRGVATASDQPHRLRCRDPVAQIYLDPESAAGLALRQRMGAAGVRSIDIDDTEALAAALRPSANGQPDAEHLVRLIDDLTGTAAPDSSSNPIDPRVQKTLSTVHALPGRHFSRSDRAGRVAISPSRLGALVRHDIGIPIRRYLLWLRLIHAIQGLSTDANLTEAAHDAGFSDSAHLSRTFRRMFGMPPSVLQSEHVKIHDFAAGSPAAPWWTKSSSVSLRR
jgi:AraC family transcriptional regulator